MTRETRIGLLVGLVFIIMFGIVLADMTNTNKANSPQQVAGAPDDDSKTGPSVLPVLPVAEAPVYTAPIAATGHEGGTSTPVAEASFRRPDADETIEVIDPRVTRIGTSVGETPRPAGPAIDDSARLAVPPATGDASRTAATLVSYVVVAGDNPTKIAKKFYGPMHGGDFKKIMDANRITNAASLKVGMKLVIPDIPQTAAPTRPAVAVSPVPTTPPSLAIVPPTGRPSATAVVSPTTRPAPVVSALRPLPREATIADLRGRFAPAPTVPATVDPTAGIAAAGTGHQKAYVVKAGDSLSKIARQNNTTINKILNANKDKLDNPDDLQVGDMLAIPG